MIVVPLTTNLLLENAPGNVLLEKEESSLSKDSVIIVSPIGVLDKSRLIAKVSRISKGILEDVEYGIKMVLGIT